MTASYPSLLASGIDSEGRFDPFDLFAGESKVVSSRFQAADGQAIKQFEVCTLNAAGQLIPLSQSGDFASGTITVGGQPTADDTVTVAGITITFVSADPAATGECLIGADATETATNLRAAINDDPAFAVPLGVTASGSGTTVTVTANSIGTAGNAITLAEAVTSASFTLSGSTLAGANAAEDVPSGNAIAIAAQAVSATTPGTMVPVYTGGVFNHEVLVWPAGLGTLAARKMVFAGSPISVEQLL